MKEIKMKIAVPKVIGARLTSAEIKDGYILAEFKFEKVEENELECKSTLKPSMASG